MPRCDLRDWFDVYHAQRVTREFAATLGFGRRDCQELAIVASELASNVLKYGPPGALELSEMRDDRGRAVRLAAIDQGPQFHDFAAALKDGYDDRGPIDPLQMLKRRGIGGGLGAVVRFSDSVDVEPRPIGKQIVVVRYMQRLSARGRRH